jgi:chorismate mutase
MHTRKPHLDLIAAHLEGLEETIIWKLIDRAQFRRNAGVYEPGKSGFEGNHGESLFDLRLRYQEEMDAVFGRFMVPEERPFNRDLPPPRRAVHIPSTGLSISDYDSVNLSTDIQAAYRQLLGALCQPDDDGQYGSSVEHDVYALQAIGRRVHYGSLYIAESKYLADTATYRQLIAAGDTAGLLTLLTRQEVEDRIIIRVRDKVNSLQLEVNPAVRRLIDPEVVCAFYRDFIIPLTKRGEILYLMQRMEHAQEKSGS